MNGTSNKFLRKLNIGKKNIAMKIVIYVVALFVAYLTLMPFILMLEDLWATPVSASVDPRVPVEYTYSWKNFFDNINIFKKSDNYLWITFKNSFIVATASTLLNVYFSAMTAYAVTAYEWKLKRAFSNFILAIILGPLVERNLTRALQLSDGAIGPLFSSPICIILYSITVIMLAWPFIRKRFRKEKKTAQ